MQENGQSARGAPDAFAKQPVTVFDPEREIMACPQALRRMRTLSRAVAVLSATAAALDHGHRLRRARQGVCSEAHGHRACVPLRHSDVSVGYPNLCESARLRAYWDRARLALPPLKEGGLAIPTIIPNPAR